MTSISPLPNSLKDPGISSNNIKEAFKVIKDIFRKGHEDVYLYGGRIGSWR